MTWSCKTHPWDRVLKENQIKGNASRTATLRIKALSFGNQHLVTSEWNGAHPCHPLLPLFSYFIFFPWSVRGSARHAATRIRKQWRVAWRLFRNDLGLRVLGFLFITTLLKLDRNIGNILRIDDDDSCSPTFTDLSQFKDVRKDVKQAAKTD